MWLSCFSACLDSRCLCCSRHMWHPCCFSITCGSEPRCERGVQNAVCWLHEISSLYWKSVIYTVFLSCLESMLYSYAWYDILSSSAVMVIEPAQCVLQSLLHTNLEKSTYQFSLCCRHDFTSFWMLFITAYFWNFINLTVDTNLLQYM